MVYSVLFFDMRKDVCERIMIEYHDWYTFGTTRSINLKILFQNVTVSQRSTSLCTYTTAWPRGPGGSLCTIFELKTMYVKETL